MISGAFLPFGGVLVKECLGLLDSGQGQIVRLDLVAMVFHHQQIKPSGAEHADDDEREKRQAPKQADQDGSIAGESVELCRHHCFPSFGVTGVDWLAGLPPPAGAMDFLRNETPARFNRQTV